MRYTLTLALPTDLPTWARDTLTAVLDEYLVAWTHWGNGMLDVSGDSERPVRLACTAALARIGKTIDDVVIDLL